MAFETKFVNILFMKTTINKYQFEKMHIMIWDYCSNKYLTRSESTLTSVWSIHNFSILLICLFLAKCSHPKNYYFESKFLTWIYHNKSKWVELWIGLQEAPKLLPFCCTTSRHLLFQVDHRNFLCKGRRMCIFVHKDVDCRVCLKY